MNTETVRASLLLLQAALAAIIFGQRPIQESPLYRSSHSFPDVPENNWAFDALKRMKSQGLLVGYPSVRANSPASRYELAVAVHATYVHTRNILDSGLSGGFVDGKTVRQAALEAQEPLSRLALVLSLELTTLGVDVPRMVINLRQHLALRHFIPQEMTEASENTFALSTIERYEKENLVRLHHDGDGGEGDTGHPNDLDLALATYQAFMQIDEMVGRAQSSVHIEKIASVMECVRLADRASEIQKLAKLFSKPLAVLGIDYRDIMRGTSAWKSKTEDLWSEQGMRHWGASR